MTELSDRQREVLAQVSTAWLRPMDMGGRDGSHHSGILATLARKGLVERRQRGGMTPSARGSYVYRITDEGQAALRESHDSGT